VPARPERDPRVVERGERGVPLAGAHRDHRVQQPEGAAQELVAGVRDVLAEAIAAGGATLRDFRAADGGLGTFQHRFSVYDREGAPCPTPGCAGTIRRIVQSGRSSFFCPVCQRP
jgi:formamidopyrimidine-DNA glycosylase